MDAQREDTRHSSGSRLPTTALPHREQDERVAEQIDHRDAPAALRHPDVGCPVAGHGIERPKVLEEPVVGSTAAFDHRQLEVPPADRAALGLIRMDRLARALAAHGYLREGVTVEEAVDILTVITSFQSFDELFTGSGLTADVVADRLIAMAERSVCREGA